MTKSLSLVLFFVVLSALRAAMLVRASKQFVVGGSQGWREPAANDTALYSRWAAINRFQIGDSLYFRYTNDSVLLVDKKGYYHCNTNNPIAAFSDGKTVINLDRSGPFYFISSFDVHCNNGQRLIVEVMTPHQPPSPPQTSSPSPSPMPSAAVSPSLSAVTIFMATLGWSLLLSSNSVIFLAMANPTGWSQSF